MLKKRLLMQSLRYAFLIGGILALFVSLTTFREMPHSWWLIWHNLLVIISLVMVALIGYNHRRFEASFSAMLLSCAAFFIVVAVLYLSSYALTTGLFAGKMAWIPFFYRDYTYHGFKSVADYLNYKDNYRELLVLQVFSFLVGSVMYFASASLGYFSRAIIEGARRRRKALRSLT